MDDLNLPEENRILGRVDVHEFVGRGRELEQLIAHPERQDARGLLLLLEPSAGVSELLRQAYDQLFQRHGVTIPIYFALSQEETTPVSAAIEFLNTFLSQYLAFRRHEPELVHVPRTLNEILALAPSTDYEWIEQLVEAYNQRRFGSDDCSLIRWCLSAPQKIPNQHGRAFVMLDAVPLRESPNASASLGLEMFRTLSRSGLPYAIAGLRRQLLGVAHSVHLDFDTFEVIKLEGLSDDDGRFLVEHLARRQRLGLSEEVRDLMVHQFECSPFFISAFVQAARERVPALTSYLDCERLYVDDLMGGRINRYFNSLLEEIAPDPELRRGLIRVLYESNLGNDRHPTFDAWKRTLNLAAQQLEQVLRALHVHEFITWDGGSIEAGGGATVWKDYLRARYRLELAGDPRALVVAETVTEALKRAPRTMARYYRRVASLGLRDLVARFNRQRVPLALLDYGRFNRSYKGAPPKAIAEGLEAESQLMSLPQVVHVATCASFSADMLHVCDEERCVVAHGFQDGNYTQPNEVVWLVAEIDAKLEADAEVTTSWCERLERLAAYSGFRQTRIWLVAREGFSAEALTVLAAREGYGSSRSQLELLASRLSEPTVLGENIKASNDFEMVVPMGGDNEMIVARAVEQIARRLNFRPEAINQIKHAVVEACINASEHSFSPDQKLYQRLRVENDKIVIIISSRGIVPGSTGGPGTTDTTTDELRGAEAEEKAAERRGWGLGIIRTLMDEVEFERVDDGTSLRMTKFLHR